MKVIRTSFDRHEERRDRRYPLPPLVVVIEGAEYTTVNWSLGGFLVSGFAGEIPVGATIMGKLRVGEEKRFLRFTGTVVRVDTPEPGYLAVQFNELGEDGIGILDRYVARRAFRGRAGS
ncbi:MAG TPA: PilZ domain-containing protein [Stellaceae bacterium]|nr:PilZ domain-containing protein [Stellaceae bacterium]